MKNKKEVIFKKVGGVYVLEAPIYYYSKRYKKSISIPKGYPSNGADVVRDVCPLGFFVHDVICYRGKWDDGSKMTNREASTVYADILKEKGFWWRSKIRWVGTFLGGGGEARKNGMWSLKNG